MKNLLFELLQVILVAAIPTITTFLCSLLRQKAKETAAKTENTTVKKHLDEVADAITTAVSFASQTYVDTLKNQNQFNAENQEEAFKIAMEKAVEIISFKAKDYIEMTYGDVMRYLATKIEKEVYAQKSGILSIAEFVPEN